MPRPACAIGIWRSSDSEAAYSLPIAARSPNGGSILACLFLFAGVTYTAQEAILKVKKEPVPAWF
jgi:hypothetical protein